MGETVVGAGVGDTDGDTGTGVGPRVGDTEGAVGCFVGEGYTGDLVGFLVPNTISSPDDSPVDDEYPL